MKKIEATEVTSVFDRGGKGVFESLEEDSKIIAPDRLMLLKKNKKPLVDMTQEEKRDYPAEAIWSDLMVYNW